MAGFLDGKVALVTGGGTGIGAAAAEALARHGAAVAITGRRVARLDEVAGRITTAGGQVATLVSDVADEASATAAVEAAVAGLGRLDVVINSAGVNEAGGIGTLDLAGWRKVIDINLWGTIHTCKAALPHLRAAGGGDIVNISSTAGRRAAGLFASYATSKHGVNGFTESIRQELGGENIRVCLIEPGATETEIAQSVSDPVWAEMMQQHVSKAGAMQAGDIAEAIIFALMLPRRANVSQMLIRPTIDTAPM
ncbi:SDR family oxidoreductase [Novosphingobium aerophilum]|uniref:SDR family NAD(P)-dependent oxidoreductase n=1 Tax=Novosphingobium aerophilum TaxID=2839843 RepID=A0A7X1KAR4_9SPHN|nr:SDR family NAD(P)-dependent oxidoreductase [Novosphingobium aerophilum]MBC2650405.1 SDR family NAD(P)-dependent oxidoreductase [Novosphingobium aerophilum]